MNINPRIKHYIITRFNNAYACKDMPKEDFLSEYHLRKKLEMFKNFTLKSLKSQTNQNFTDLLLVHDDIPQVIYDELTSLIKDYSNIKLLKNKEIDVRLNEWAGLLSATTSKYIRKTLDIKQYDFLITSRFDYDDMLYKHAIKDIHNSVKENTLIKYFGFKNGCTLDYNTGAIYEFDKPSNDGMISIGFSLIVNLNIYGVLPFNIYAGHHSKMRTAFLENNLNVVNKIHPLSDDYINSENFWEPKSTCFPAWVYVRHNEAKSAFIPGRFGKNKLHRSDIPVHKEIINENFFKYF
jgi:hypothetical protein